jgi:hypothetical protein
MRETVAGFVNDESCGRFLDRLEVYSLKALESMDVPCNKLDYIRDKVLGLALKHQFDSRGDLFIMTVDNIRKKYVEPALMEYKAETKARLEKELEELD